jgi:hypothetical protein
VIAQTKDVILPARLAYRYDGDLDKLLNISCAEISKILNTTSQLLGHLAGLQQSPDDDPAFNKLLEANGLASWIKVFQSDLESIWTSQGRWNSFEEIKTLQCHTERLMWQFGMFPWRQPDGILRVEVPLQTDAEALTRDPSLQT